MGNERSAERDFHPNPTIRLAKAIKNEIITRGTREKMLAVFPEMDALPLKRIRPIKTLRRRKPIDRKIIKTL